jgi:hypothetical protein
MGAAALVVSVTAAVTRKRSRVQRHWGQRPTASDMVEDGNRARWSRRCRVPPGRRVGDGDRRMAWQRWPKRRRAHGRGGAGVELRVRRRWRCTDIRQPGGVKHKIH